LVPTAVIETGYGYNVGARFIYRNVFGERGRLRLRAGYGGRFEQEAAASLTTGTLFGERFELGLRSEYQVHPRSRFWGIGNTDGVASRYRHDDVDVGLGALVRVARSFTLRLNSAYHWTRFDPDADLRGDQDIADAYDTSTLTGYDTGLSNLRTTLSAGYDTRRVTRDYLSKPAPSTGWHLTGFAEVQLGIGDDPSRFIRWGGDVQRYFDLWLGDRVLILRVYVEGVSGEMDRIPFIDLPALGGQYLLRGYSRDRYRDRYAAAATAEYDYPVQKQLTGFLFVDGGRVWRSVDDLEATDVRVGFGGGIQFHTRSSFLGRLFVATSIDGGVQFNLSFDPVFGTNSRTERDR
jgi:outer membrane protein assembly factor BamA